ncbi:hypothetical protein EV356DRAFT_448418 [Viridothelium virens]|uniref:Uncharacterized protein n=1 Tax=Viridothelium virens TaxID=1048519 RepID=A0A6A6H5W1_VIRVR|nr:hypothetical protein EV356DRAFT_448418 [Viridothelium virens]
MAQPIGVNLVGSMPTSIQSSEEAFIKCTSVLSDRLLSIPDGETGARSLFTVWQAQSFPKDIYGILHNNWQSLENPPARRFTLDDVGPTRYDDVAIESYKTFCDLREKGAIPPGVRFQVAIPSSVDACATHVDHAYIAQVEPLYRKRLLQSLRNLQDHIPAQDLAIQFDLPFALAYTDWERGRHQIPFFKPWFEPVREGLMQRIEELSDAVDKEVWLAYHLCYGDINHKHYLDPEDSKDLVTWANDITQRIAPKHAIQWFHMPVPKDRTDYAYFEPLKQLRIGYARLFLGVVHAHDEAGTEQRIKSAQKVCTDFGIATECGLGRTPNEDLESILEISKKLSAPFPLN